MSSGPEKYVGREVNYNLTQQVRNITEDYIGGVEDQLVRRFGMEIRLFGSVSAGNAIFWQGGNWFLHDVDFFLDRQEAGISFEEAMALRGDRWFWDQTQKLLGRIDLFVKKNHLARGILEADFGYQPIHLPDPLFFAIGYRTRRPDYGA